MKKVEPIRCIEQLNHICCYLEDENKRDYLLFRLGINLGLRVSDLLALRVEDVKGKDCLYIKEQKGKRQHQFLLSESLQKEIETYIGEREEGLLFRSRNSGRMLTRQRAYLILRRAAKAVGFEDAIGTHTLRKTFGYWAYQKGVPIESIRKLFGHATSTVTFRYIGINTESQNRSNVFIPLDI